MNVTVIQVPPFWARQKTILELFEIGRNKLDELRKSGKVLTHVDGNNVLYKVSDINEALEAEAQGKIPEVKVVW